MISILRPCSTTFSGDSVQRFKGSVRGSGYRRFVLSFIVFLWLLVPGALVYVPCAADPFRIPGNEDTTRLSGGMSYTPPTALAFDTRNRPYLFNADRAEHFGSIFTLRDGRWKQLNFADDLREAFPEMQSPTARTKHARDTMTIDDAGHLYAIVYVRRQPGENPRPVLLYADSFDGTFDVHEIPGSPDRAFLEVRTGNHVLNRPPVIGTLTFRKEYPTRWTSYYTLSVVSPEKRNGKLVPGSPITITNRCFGVSNHSGGYSFAVTTGRFTHVTYAEIPPERKGGNPTYAATVNRRTGEVRSRTHLVTAPPKKADVHSTPVIAADADGYLHALSGAHGESFRHLRSNEPNRTSAGWTDPVKLGDRQTYATLVCDGSNRLHTVYRRWTSLPKPLLTHQSREARDGEWTKPRVLANPPSGHEGYGIFYHRLFVDRRGRLYLTFTFWEQETKDRGSYPRVLVTSDDGGRTWEKASTSVLSERISASGK